MVASNGNGDVVLDVRDLRTYFVTRWGVVKAVEGVSFQLRRGETLGIVGESGSGKSVTALSVMRLVPSPPGHNVGGEVLLEGEDILKLNESEMEDVRGQRIGMVLQDPMTALNPVFDIQYQVGETLKIHQGLSGSGLRDSVVDMLRRVRIPAPELRMRDYPHHLSGGMRQRVVGAIGISCNPAVLIADEPTTSLDATIQAQYLRLLRELQEATGVGIIFITHDFGIVAKMCDKVAVMYAGRIVEQRRRASDIQQPVSSIHRGPYPVGAKDGGDRGEVVLHPGSAARALGPAPRLLVRAEMQVRLRQVSRRVSADLRGRRRSNRGLLAARGRRRGSRRVRQ